MSATRAAGLSAPACALRAGKCIAQAGTFVKARLRPDLLEAYPGRFVAELDKDLAGRALHKGDLVTAEPVVGGRLKDVNGAVCLVCVQGHTKVGRVNLAALGTRADHMDLWGLVTMLVSRKVSLRKW